MAPRWQQQLAEAWAAELLELADTVGHAAVAAAAVRVEAALDPAVSPLLTALPAKAVALLLRASAAGGQPEQQVVAGWAARELETPRRQAEGWLVVGGGGKADGRQAKESRAVHLVIRAGTTKIDDEAFCGCSSVVSVAIPASVTKIGQCAFFDCRSLLSVAIPASVTAQLVEYYFKIYYLIIIKWIILI